ncbi:uncharacterized protein N7458_007015 [Penicillium daleae]|uniref:Secreted protein n=1 Tax=Penicillium daleae TaxID=63821 RepID=A0AAD6G3I7_9EURO|nr:uncharacterized protein N7458_007015 [Penicillium daleae]KAJ5450566.1 hypothetical protein N7458_007015 [Penicillium daleae]
MPLKIDTTALIVLVVAILGSHHRTASSSTYICSSHRDTPIPDHSTHTDSHASVFPTVGQ